VIGSSIPLLFRLLLTPVASLRAHIVVIALPIPVPLFSTFIYSPGRWRQKFLRNVLEHLPDYKALHPRRWGYRRENITSCLCCVNNVALPTADGLSAWRNLVQCLVWVSFPELDVSIWISVEADASIQEIRSICRISQNCLHVSNKV
jgi:hypothetical protein